MRVIVAPDSFKEALSANDVAAAITRGIRAERADADIVALPLSDGGEGFARIYAHAVADGTPVEYASPSRDALGRARTATWFRHGNAAILDVAESIGLAHVDLNERDILASHSGGVGDLLRAALDAGVSSITLGLGGTATSDVGLGLLAALGARFLDAAGRTLRPVPARFAEIASVNLDGLDARLGDTSIIAACDVTAPLTGPTGASAVFGPQKGATQADVDVLDAQALRLSELIGASHDFPGAGAAGGLGWALASFCGATLRPGFELVAQALRLEAQLASADVVVTGEGRFDAQSNRGKVVGELLRRVPDGVRVVVLAGDVHPAGTPGVVCVTPPGTPLPQALDSTAANVEAASSRVFRELADELGR